MIVSGVIKDPSSPIYSFPIEQDDTKGFTFYIVIAIFIIIFILSIVGYYVEHSSLGNKSHAKAMVEAYEEEAPARVSIEAQKYKWALIVYSFSFTKNFNEIFFKGSKTIKDKNFEVLNGLRVVMLIWIMFGHCYMMGYRFGNSNLLLL